MKLEDYELVEFAGHRLRKVPELPQPGGRDVMIRGPACDMCVAQKHIRLCGRINESSLSAHACRIGTIAEPCIFLPEEHFQEYVVELVRRRVSS